MLPILNYKPSLLLRCLSLLICVTFIVTSTLDKPQLCKTIPLKSASKVLAPLSSFNSASQTPLPRAPTHFFLNPQRSKIFVFIMVLLFAGVTLLMAGCSHLPRRRTMSQAEVRAAAQADLWFFMDYLKNRPEFRTAALTSLRELFQNEMVYLDQEDIIESQFELLILFENEDNFNTTIQYIRIFAIVLPSIERENPEQASQIKLRIKNRFLAKKDFYLRYFDELEGRKSIASFLQITALIFPSIQEEQPDVAKEIMERFQSRSQFFIRIEPPLRRFAELKAKLHEGELNDREKATQ